MNTSEKITQLQQAMSLLAQKIVMLNPDYRELHGRLQLLLEIQEETVGKLHNHSLRQEYNEKEKEFLKKKEESNDDN